MDTMDTKLDIEAIHETSWLQQNLEAFCQNEMADIQM